MKFNLWHTHINEKNKILLDLHNHFAHSTKTKVYL
jgi:hypothetical protein